MTEGPLLGHPKTRVRRIRRVMALFGCFVVLALLAYLEFIGLPYPLLQRVISQLEQQGLWLRVQSVRLRVPHGLRIDGVRIFETQNDLIPILEADHLLARLPWWRIFRYQRPQPSLDLRGGLVKLRCGKPSEPTRPQNVVSISNLACSLEWHPNFLTIHIPHAFCHSLNLRVHGEIAFAPDKKPARLADTVSALRDVLDQIPSETPQVLSKLDDLRFSTSPRVNITVKWDSQRPTPLFLQFDAAGEQTVAGEVTLTEWKGIGSLTNGWLSMELTLRQGNNHCVISGALSVETREAEAHIFSSLSPSVWVSWVSPRFARPLPLKFSRASELEFEAWLGPAPLTSVAHYAKGWLSLKRATIADVPVNWLFAEFRQAPECLRAPYLGLEIPNLKMRGEGTLWWTNVAYEISVRAQGNPHALMPWLPKGMADFFREFEDCHHMAGEGVARGVVTNLAAFSLQGDLFGTNFVFRRTEVDQLTTTILFTNDVLSLAPLQILRNDGSVQSELHIDFTRELCFFSGASTIHPEAFAQLISSNVAKIVGHFSFEGETELVSMGCIDFKTGTESEFDALVRGTKAGWRDFHASHITGEVALCGFQVTVTNAHAQVYDGQLQASGRLDGIGQTSETPAFAVSLALHDVDFNRAVCEIRHLQDPPYSGVLSGSLSITGLASEGWAETLSGEGYVRIEDGYLLKLPIFGGLLNVLSKLYPGLSFITQQDLETEFRIADGLCCSDFISLESPIISLTGSGCYRFDGRLDFRTQVQLLRRGYVGTAVRLVTFPVTKLLEFHLGGTIDDPKWRPRNLPKELFLMFD